MPLQGENAQKMTKNDLRRTLRQDAMTHERPEFDAQVPDCQTVMLFSALPDEVDMQAFADKCLNAGKTVLLPVVKGDDIEVRSYEGQQKMQSGAFGILEPQTAQFVDYQKIDVIYVPGMAFTEDGSRLGRGKGYYDRFLSLPALRNVRKIGVCASWRKVENLPCEAHDVKMDEVIFV